MQRYLTSCRMGLVLLVGVVLLSLPSSAIPADKDKTPDVIFVPTPQEVVDKMLELAEVKKDDVVYDLGCGDGRIVVTAAKKFGCKATGFDVDPKRIEESNENVKKNKVGDLVTIKKEDIFTLDLSKANVITLYLLPSLNVKLIPQLEKMKAGSPSSRTPSTWKASSPRRRSRSPARTAPSTPSTCGSPRWRRKRSNSGSESLGCSIGLLSRPAPRTAQEPFICASRSNG